MSYLDGDASFDEDVVALEDPFGHRQLAVALHCESQRRGTHKLTLAAKLIDDLPCLCELAKGKEADRNLQVDDR